MSSNCLGLNPTRTQLIWFGACKQLAKVDLEFLADKCPHFTFLSTVRDLGVTLDQVLTFVRHINLLFRSYYYQLRLIRVLLPSPFPLLLPLPLVIPLLYLVSTAVAPCTKDYRLVGLNA